MKRVTQVIIPLTGLFLMVNFLASGQENEAVSWLSDFKGEISTGNDTYKYDFVYFNKPLCGISVTAVKTDKKGNETTTRDEVYLSDIDQNTIRFKVTGKYITVSMDTKNGQKFIKDYTGDEFKGYISSVDIYTDQVEKARNLTDVLKEQLKLCTYKEMSWSSQKEVLAWLTATIGKTNNGGTEYSQKFSFDPAKNYLIDFTRKYNDSKGNEVNDDYSFNLADINQGEVNLEVSGKELSIKLNCRGGEKYIGMKTNGELQNYDNDFEIYVPDLAVARDIVQALKYAVSECKPVYKSYTDVSQALNYVKDNIKEITSGNYSFQQVFDYENKPAGLVTFISKRTDSKGSVTEDKYQFYLYELDPKANINVSGKDVSIKLIVKDKNRLIKTFKNGELQNYSYEIEMLADNIESARDLINAFNYATTNAEPGILKWTETSGAENWLAANIGTIDESGKTYAQKIAFTGDNNSKMDYSLSTKDNNGTTEELFEIYLSDIDKNNIVLNTSGKKMTVEVSTGKEKLIKATKNDEIQNYVSSIELMFDDTKQARNFIGAIKYLASTIKTPEKSFTSKQDAFKYISSNLPSVSTGTYKYDQTAEMADNDPCKLKISSVQLDSKNVSTGYIYEFSVSDIDPQAVNLEVSGKELTVKLQTRGKEKLIKPYKNGEPQNFSYDLELYTNDVSVARNLVNAFKTIIQQCGK